MSKKFKSEKATNAPPEEKNLDDVDAVETDKVDGLQKKAGENDLQTEDIDDNSDMDRDDSGESDKDEPKNITFKCPKCDRVTSTLRFLKCHFNKVHADLRLTSFDIEELLHKCGKCGDSYGDVDALKEHDCPAKQYACKHCDRVFALKSSLKQHTTIKHTSPVVS